MPGAQAKLSESVRVEYAVGRNEYEALHTRLYPSLEAGALAFRDLSLRFAATETRMKFYRVISTVEEIPNEEYITARERAEAQEKDL